MIFWSKLALAFSEEAYSLNAWGIPTQNDKNLVHRKGSFLKFADATTFKKLPLQTT
ncbi:MAG: hypothetical protein Fur0022_30090 [Anaerolineales bacterium]